MDTEQAYHDGYMDGIKHLIDMWDETNDASVGRTEHYEAFAKIIENWRRDIESE